MAHKIETHYCWACRKTFKTKQSRQLHYQKCSARGPRQQQ